MYLTAVEVVQKEIKDIEKAAYLHHISTVL